LAIFKLSIVALMPENKIKHTPRRSFMKFVIALLLFATVETASEGTSPLRSRFVEADQHAEIYSIYSLIMTNPATSHGPSTDDVYLIAEMTRLASPAEPCVRVPPQYETAYREILDEYRRRKDKPADGKNGLGLLRGHRSQ